MEIFLVKNNLKCLLLWFVFPRLDRAHGQDVWLAAQSEAEEASSETTLLSSLLCFFFSPSGCDTINAALPSFLLLCFGSVCQAVNPEGLKSQEWQGCLGAGALPGWFVAAAGVGGPVGASGCVPHPFPPVWSGVGGRAPAPEHSNRDPKDTTQPWAAPQSGSERCLEKPASCSTAKNPGSLPKLGGMYCVLSVHALQEPAFGDTPVLLPAHLVLTKHPGHRLAVGVFFDGSPDMEFVP